MIVLGTAQALRRSLGHLGGPARGLSAGLETRIDGAIAAIRTRFVLPELEAVLKTVRADGTTFLDHADGRLVNPGHAIEEAWFVMEEGRQRGDREPVELGLTMLRWT
jgi:N-acylglucosamine 2-epimerase